MRAADLAVDLQQTALSPYGEVLAGLLDGDPLLSVRGDIAEDCWRICAPVRPAWREDRVTLEWNATGSSGPSTGDNAAMGERSTP